MKITEVSKITGISTRLIHEWARLGIIESSTKNGKDRDFSSHEVAIITIVGSANATYRGIRQNGGLLRIAKTLRDAPALLNRKFLVILPCGTVRTAKDEGGLLIDLEKIHAKDSTLRAEILDLVKATKSRKPAEKVVKVIAKTAPKKVVKAAKKAEPKKVVKAAKKAEPKKVVKAAKKAEPKKVVKAAKKAC